MNPDLLTSASTLIHSFQGAALLLLAFSGLYSVRNPGSRALMGGYAALLAAAAAGPLIIAVLPGNWTASGFSQSLQFRPGLRVFIAISCLFGAAGLSGLMSGASPARVSVWSRLSVVFLLLAGAAYFLIPWRVRPEAWDFSLVPHAAVGSLVALAAVFEGAFHYSGRAGLRKAAFALLLLPALALLSFRETDAAYGPRYTTISEGQLPVKAVAKDKPVAAKKRPGN